MNVFTSDTQSDYCCVDNMYHGALLHSSVYVMAICGYSEIVGGPCGCSGSNPTNTLCEAIETCKGNIESHLKFYDCFDSTLKTEADLLLARAGNISIFLTISY